MAKDNKFALMAQGMMASGRMIKLMARECLYMQMGTFTKEAG